MRITDRIDPQTIERREFQLSVLSIVVIAVMAIGMAASVYPMVFTHPVTPDTETARKSFYSFCVLAVLMVSYLTNRQIVIRRLRRRIKEGQERIELIRRQASSDLLSTLPGMSQFQDRLTMEFRRSASTSDRISLVMVRVTAHQGLSEAGEIENAYGAAVKALLVKMRKDDSIYAFRPGGYGIVMVQPGADQIEKFSNRMIRGLEEARQAGAQFTFETRVVNHPQDAQTAYEMEQAVHSFFPVEVAAKAAVSSV